MNKEGTESVACWDCYDKSWTERMRNSIAGALPSSLRADKGSQESSYITCGRGIAQAGVDMGVGMVVIAGGGVAYVIESFGPSKTELRKHRWNQAKYGFYFIISGKLLEVTTRSAKKLRSHIVKSIVTGDTFAACEISTTFIAMAHFPVRGVVKVKNRDMATVEGLKQVAKSPRNKKVIKKEMGFVSIKPNEVIIKKKSGLDKLGERIKIVTATQSTGYHARKSRHETLEDYIDSLPQDVSP